MSASAGVKLLPSLNWMASGANDPFPLFHERLVAFVAAANANVGNANRQLTILRTHLSSTAQVRRGLVLQLGGPVEDWIWYWTQATNASNFASVTHQGGVSGLYDNGTGNDGYGSMAAGAFDSANVRSTLTYGSTTAQYVFDAMQPQAGASAVVYAQDTTPGAEWFLFNGDASASPMVTHLNPNPWTFFLGREESSGQWMVCLRRLSGLIPTSNGRYGPLSSLRPGVQQDTSTHQQQRLFSRALIRPTMRVLLPGGTTYTMTSDPRPCCLPPPVWFGPVNSNAATYPERALHVLGKIEAAGQSYFQLGRGVDPDWWVQFPSAGLPPAAPGWTAFADFAWSSRSTALTFHSMPLVTGGASNETDPRSARLSATAVKVAQNVLMRQAGLATLELQGEPVDLAGGGSSRPATGVLWPRGN